MSIRAVRPSIYRLFAKAFFAVGSFFFQNFIFPPIFLLMRPALSRSIRAVGVTTRVSTVEKLRPKTTAVASCTHHYVDGAPTESSREKKSIFICKTIGMRPTTVVTVVNRTGRKR